MSIWAELALNMDGVVALVGGGGKTTLLYALAREARDAGRTVLVTTTTHMWPHPHVPMTIWKGPEPLRRLLERHGVVLLGQNVQGGKLAGEGDIAHYRDIADVVLIEADGAKGFPLKAPADHEPVIPPQAGAVIAVAGSDCVGQPIGAVCHRPERACALLGKRPEEPITPADVAAVLSSSSGGQKSVPPGADFRCAVNKADLAPRAAEEIQKRLLALGIPTAVTAFSEKERDGGCLF